MMTKERLAVYLAGPIAGGHNAELSAAFTNHINQNHVVVNPAIVDPAFFDRDLTAGEVYSAALAALLSSKAVVAEISAPSHGVGMELAAANANGIPSLCLYDPSRTARVSAMIEGCPGLTLAEYDDGAAALSIIDSFLTHVSEKS